MRGPSPLYIEERHRALGHDATFSWSRALTHPPRCNRTRHRGRHLVSDFVGPLSWCRGGPPSWIWRRGGRHLGPEVTSKTLKWHLYYSYGGFSTSPNGLMEGETLGSGHTEGKPWVFKISAWTYGGLSPGFSTSLPGRTGDKAKWVFNVTVVTYGSMAKP